jgi:hypothetical protein
MLCTIETVVDCFTKLCRYRDDCFKCQFPHWRAGYFLLLRQKKVSKEKATRMPLAFCAPSFLSGFARRDFLSLWQSAASLPRPSGLFPTKTPVLGAAYGTSLHRA